MNEKIIVNVASYRRIDSLEKTLESIINQCDEINVALNNHDGGLPSILYNDKINLYFTDNSKGDAFKFLKLSESNGYFLTIDDDLIYPPNYVKYVINKCKEYGNKKVITLHGRNFSSFPISSYYRSASERYGCLDTVNKDVKVQFGGTGVMCFHTDLFKLKIDYFLEPNMADVWIGKYCLENKIDIICLKHDKGYIRYIPQKITIYDQESNNDGIQTNIVNGIYNKKQDLSIIIPTFNNTEFLKECLESIINSVGNYSCEILVGIDGCQKTFEYVKNESFDQRIKFYFFNKNVGPYIVKNSLSKISNSDNILFFDSDDIMVNNMITDTIKGLYVSDCIKPSYVDFTNGKSINLNSKRLLGEGVFGIKKTVFNKMNGFEPWMCAADSDFMGRLYKNKFKIRTTNIINFYRRIHKNGLTSRPDTGMSSPLRAQYAKISKNKKDVGPLKVMVTEPNSLINGVNYLPIVSNEIVNTVDTNYELMVKLRKESLEKVYNRKKNKVEIAVEKVEKKPMVIDYSKINKLLKNKVIPNPTPKVKKVDNPTENKNAMSNSEMVKTIFPGKPNRRNGDPIMTFGKK